MEKRSKRKKKTELDSDSDIDPTSDAECPASAEADTKESEKSDLTPFADSEMTSMKTSGPAESRKYESTDHDLVATGSTSIADQAPTDASDSGANTGGVKVGQSTELTLDPLGSYVVVKPVDEAFSFRKINVFWPSKQLQGICGTSKLSNECPSNGSIIVKTG